MGNDTAPVTPKPWNQTGLPTFAVVCLVIACAIALLTIMIWHVNQFTPYYSPEYLQAKDDFGRLSEHGLLRDQFLSQPSQDHRHE